MGGEGEERRENYYYVVCVFCFLFFFSFRGREAVVSIFWGGISIQTFAFGDPEYGAGGFWVHDWGEKITLSNKLICSE